MLEFDFMNNKVVVNKEELEKMYLAARNGPRQRLFMVEQEEENALVIG